MIKFIKKRSKKVGLPPGTLVHIGEKKNEKIKITIIEYDEKYLQEKEVKSIEEIFPLKKKPTITWINIDGIYNLDIIKRIGKEFSLHPLVLEDIVNAEQRAKLEDFVDYIFIVLKIPYYDDKAMKVRMEQISLIIGENFVISFQERGEDIFYLIKRRLKSTRWRIRALGADYLAYSLIDLIIDNYFIILENLEDRIEDLEEKLVEEPTSETLHIIHLLKRDITFLRNSVWPLREVIKILEKGELSLIQEATKIYFRDVYDHTIWVIDTIERYREMITGMLDIYFSSVSDKMNKIMMFLTIIGTIFLPLTFITGIYGMNFRYMPELKWPWAYPSVLIFMFFISIGMLLYFKKKRWL